MTDHAREIRAGAGAVQSPVVQLEELRGHWKALDDDAQTALRALLPGPGATVLWDREPTTASDYDPERRAPFNRAINVFGSGVPR
jgi:hypothetical protein